MYFRVNFKVSYPEDGGGKLWTVRVESGTGAAPAVIATWTDGGTFRHGADHDTVQGLFGDNPETFESHVLRQHVIAAMEATVVNAKNPETWLNGGRVVIEGIDLLRSASIGAGTIAITGTATSAVQTIVPTPANASLKDFVLSIVDPTKATVQRLSETTYTVTGVAAGSTNVQGSGGGAGNVTRAVTVS